MRLNQQPGVLEVTVNSIGFNLIFVGFGFGAMALPVFLHKKLEMLIRVILFGAGALFVLVGIVSWQSKRVRFDMASRTMTWRKRTIRGESTGSMALADIRAIAVESDPGDGRRAQSVYLQTMTGDFTFGNVATANSDEIRQNITTIAAFLKLPIAEPTSILSRRS